MTGEPVDLWRRAAHAGRAPRVAALLCFFGAQAAVGAGQFVEDVRISRRGDEATVTIALACPMRFRSDAAAPGGAALEIRIAPLDGCRQLGAPDGIASELYRPAGGHLAHLVDVEYEALGLGESLLLLGFDRRVDYRVAQRGDLRTLELRVRVADDGELLVPAAPEPLPPERGENAQAAQRTPERAPLAPRVRTPAVVADYVVNLQSTREPVPPAATAAVPVPPGRRLYVSTTIVAGVTWYRLRLGFFASEADARAALGALAAPFPRAWVGRAESAEVSAAELARDSAVTGTAEDLPQLAATPNVAGTALAPGRVAELLAEGRAAIVGGDFAGAIRVYTRLVEEPGPHGPEARENLGLAREKNGQAAHAAAEYRRFLADYPGHESEARVRQRLAGLVTAGAAPRERLRAATGDEGRWDVTTGVAQYYRRDVNRFAEDQPEVITLSALFTDLDIAVRRNGESVDWLGRVSVNHLHDLEGADRGGPGDRQRIAYAFLDVSTRSEVGIRVGRQSLHHGGVLGRFDGAHATYGRNEGRRLHVTTGFPVESTRNPVETDRRFLGAAVDFDELAGAWNFSPFVMTQTIDGIADRRAVGLEASYADERRNFTTMVDYDVDYAALNTALAFGTWRLGNGTTLTALYDDRSSPVLTTRNALIGQPVGTVEELLLVWTEDEIRQIARDRTAESRAMTFGVAAPIAERWQISADITATEIGSTVASAGVAAVPATSRQTYYSASLVGSALFGGSDVSIFSLRYGESGELATSQLTWDLRIPVGGARVRLNPRLKLAVWESPLTRRRREAVAPSLRLLVVMPRRYRLELEVGADRLTRTDSGGEQNATGRFLNLGYRADF